jgi:hypothetical protein
MKFQYSRYLIVVSTTILFLSTLLSCINRNRIIAAGTDSTNDEQLVQEAESLFFISPRNPSNVVRAFNLMSRAVQETSDQNPQRFEYLVRASWFAIWLAYYGEQGEEKAMYAEKAMVFCNTAVKLLPDRTEGYYYRSIATGLFAEEKQLYGKDAMGKIKEDALKAAEIDPTYDYGGPQRVLGALYLRAPGPPAGLGSPRRAVFYLKNSLAINPDYPETQLFLAEAYLKLKDRLAATKVLDQFEIDQRFGDETDWDHWDQRYRELLEMLESSQ